VAGEWNSEFNRLDGAVTDPTDAVRGDSVAAIKRALAAIEASADLLLGIAAQAAP
jgi:hypothetical protein